MHTTSTFERPLAGVRVLDLSRVISGPLCGRILADMGAEVIKVESPEGDLLRQMQPMTKGVSHVYAHFNAGKRQLCVDLKHEQGPGLLADLVERSDILLENFRPGVADRLGIGASSMLARNSRLIYCSITGWGQEGQDSDRAAYAPMIHAEMGMMALAAAMRSSSVQQEIHHHADLYTGVMASSAILAAFVQLARTGKGQHVDVSMAEVALYVNEYATMNGYAGPDTIDSFTFEIFPIGDGTVVSLIGNPRRMFPAWSAALQASARELDPEFRLPDLDDRDLDAVRTVMTDLMRRIPDLQSLTRSFAPHGLLYGVVRSLDDALNTDWAVERDLMAELAPGLRIPRTPWRIAGRGSQTHAMPGDVGADNTSVLQDVLDLSPVEVESLSTKGVIHQPTSPHDVP